MDTSRPDIDFHSTYEGIGELRRGDLTVPVYDFRLERVKHEHSSPWYLKVNVGDGHVDDLLQITDDSTLPLTLTGTANRRHSLYIPSVPWFRTDGPVLQANVRSFDLDSEPFVYVPAKQRLAVYLTDNPLTRDPFLLIPNADGTIENHGKQFPQLPFDLEIGTGTLSLKFGFEQAMVQRSEVLVRVPQPFLDIEVKPDRLTADSEGSLTSCAEELHRALRLLSFLSRQHVSWTQIGLSGYAREENQETRLPQRPRRFHVARATHSLEGRSALVWPGRLTSDALSQMYHALVQLPYSQAVLYSMAYLVQAFGDRQVETSLALGFTALESLVSAIGEIDRTSYILEDDEFKPLADFVHESVKQYAKAQGWHADRRRQLYEKVQELQRASIVPRVASVVRSRNVEWQDLWPEGTDLEVALREEYDVRNRLIHTGVIDNPWRAIAAKARIHALTERLVYCIIGGQAGWRDVEAYKHCLPLRSGPAWPALV